MILKVSLPGQLPRWIHWTCDMWWHGTWWCSQISSCDSLTRLSHENSSMGISGQPVENGNIEFQCNCYPTVDGGNLANQLVGSLFTLFTFFTGFYTSQVVGNGISSINSTNRKIPFKNPWSMSPSFQELHRLKKLIIKDHLQWRRPTSRKPLDLPPMQDAIVAKKVDMYRHAMWSWWSLPSWNLDLKMFSLEKKMTTNETPETHG